MCVFEGGDGGVLSGVVCMEGGLVRAYVCVCVCVCSKNSMSW